MKTQRIDGIEVHRGPGDVFADLGLPDIDKPEAGMVIVIRKAMRSRGFTQQQAAKRTGFMQSKVFGRMRGDFTMLSDRKRMDCLTRLGYDIEVKVRPANTEVGHLMLATA